MGVLCNKGVIARSLDADCAGVRVGVFGAVYVLEAKGDEAAEAEMAAICAAIVDTETETAAYGLSALD